VSVALVIQRAKAHAPYCHLWLAWLCHIFPHYLINGTIFGKMLLNIKCVFWFSVQLLSETFLTLRNIQRDIVVNVRRSCCKVPLLYVGLVVKCRYSWHFLMKLEFSRRISEKSWGIKFHESPSSGSRVVACGRADRQIDRHDEANSRFSQFCEPAWWRSILIRHSKSQICVLAAAGMQMTSRLYTAPPVHRPHCKDALSAESYT
jgi:hypothetical protein